MLRPDKTNRRNPEPSLLLAARTLLHFSRSPFLRASIFVLLCLAFATCLRADTISGTVKDPTESKSRKIFSARQAGGL